MKRSSMKKYDSYKDSGIEWIGEIPSHWKAIPMRFLLRNKITDGPHETPKFISEGISFLSVDGIQNGELVFEGCRKISKDDYEKYKSKCVVEKHDILMGKAASVGKVAQVKVDFEFGIWSPLALLKPNHNKITSSFFEYFLKSTYAKYNANILSTFNTQQNISMTDIPRIYYIIPNSIKEQMAITTFLDQQIANIDQQIADKKRLLELYEEEKTGVINRAVTKGLNPDACMKESGVEWLGEIPEGWEVKRLKYVLTEKLKYGANESAIEENREHPRYIRITDFGNNGLLKEETFKSLSPDKANEYILKDGDILFARSGATVGKTFQFKNYNGIACFAGYLIKASTKPSVMLSDFLYQFTKSGAYENWKNSIFNQATIQNIGADKYAFLEIPTPTIVEQQVIIQYIENQCARINKKKEYTTQLIALLEEYKQALISEVVTGKIKVV